MCVPGPDNKMLYVRSAWNEPHVAQPVTSTWTLELDCSIWIVAAHFAKVKSNLGDIAQVTSDWLLN